MYLHACTIVDIYSDDMYDIFLMFIYRLLDLQIDRDVYIQKIDR